MQRELHGVATAACYRQYQRRHRFTPSKHFPTKLRVPNRQRYPPLEVFVEQFQQSFEGSLDVPPFSIFSSRRVRVMVHIALFWSHFDARNFTCTAVADDLFSNAKCTPLKESTAVPRQTKLGVDLSACVRPQL